MTDLETQKTFAKIAAHASAVHRKADILESILKATNACIGHPEREDLMVHLVEGAIEIAREVSRDLEDVTWPKSEAA